MTVQNRLAGNLVQEAQAYGYTLSVWGGGAVLLNRFGTPSILQIHLYVGAALLGFGLLSLVAFDHLFTETEPPDDRRLIAASTIHIVGTFANLMLSFAVATFLQGAGVPEGVAFAAVGLHVTVTYNLGLVTEARLAALIADVSARPEGSG